jgi:DNA processing protein
MAAFIQGIEERNWAFVRANRVNRESEGAELSGQAKPTISASGRGYLRLHLCDEVGPIRARRLVEHFGNVEAIFGASMAELQRVEGIGPVIAKSIFKSRGADGARRRTGRTIDQNTDPETEGTPESNVAKNTVREIEQITERGSRGKIGREAEREIERNVEQEIERAGEAGIRIICFADEEYPEPLRHIPDPPICLYVKGELRPTDAVALAIVGTRKCSHYGREQAVRFGEILARAGFTIVSGLARGIDGYAHSGALRGGGRTIAVLGNGLPKIYPPEHESLAEQIAGAGAMVTESPMDLQPAAENFPRRNRIIVGLSLGVVVVEAGLRSGALITARLANEYNRECFALPGRVDHPEQTAGVNKLIREGEAKLVTCLEDVLDELGQVGAIMGKETSAGLGGGSSSGAGEVLGSRSARREGVVRSNTSSEAFVRNLSEDERAILALLKEGVSAADDFIGRSALDVSRVMATLTSLQLKGLVRQLPGSRFECRRRE